MATKKTDVRQDAVPRDEKENDLVRLDESQANPRKEQEAYDKTKLRTQKPHPEPRQNPGK